MDPSSSKLDLLVVTDLLPVGATWLWRGLKYPASGLRAFDR
jgi:hypothetical protein